MSRTAWRFVRLGTAVAVLAVIAIRLGTGPFVRGLESVDGRSLTAAAAIAAVSTACCAWRWCLVARGLGVPLPFRSAVAAYYRSQFLNSALPGGLVGDIHRGISHGRDAGDLGRGLCAVAWERTAGQAVQVVAAVLVLVALSSPVRAAMPVVLCCAAVCLVAAVLSVRAAGGRRRLGVRECRAGRHARRCRRDRVRRPGGGCDSARRDRADCWMAGSPVASGRAEPASAARAGDSRCAERPWLTARTPC